MVIKQYVEELLPANWVVNFFNRKAALDAMKTLKDYTFKLYIYLITYPKEEGSNVKEFAATAKEIAVQCGMDKEDLFVALDELEEKRYLYDAGNKYFIFSMPLPKNYHYNAEQESFLFY